MTEPFERNYPINVKLVDNSGAYASVAIAGVPPVIMGAACSFLAALRLTGTVRLPPQVDLTRIALGVPDSSPIITVSALQVLGVLAPAIAELRPVRGFAIADGDLMPNYRLAVAAFPISLSAKDSRLASSGAWRPDHSLPNHQRAEAVKQQAAQLLLSAAPAFGVRFVARIHCSMLCSGELAVSPIEHMFRIIGEALSASASPAAEQAVPDELDRLLDEAAKRST